MPATKTRRYANPKNKADMKALGRFIDRNAKKVGLAKKKK